MKEEEETKVIRRFDAGQLAKITKALEILFVQTNNWSEDMAVKLDECVSVEPANVCMVIAKTEEAKRCLSLFVNTQQTPKIPNIDYVVRKDDVNKLYTSSYSMDYTISILNVLKHTQDYFKISLKEDQASVIETEHFKFLLAPRIESE